MYRKVLPYIKVSLRGYKALQKKVEVDLSSFFRAEEGATSIGLFEA
jgi:hypothetical protein